MEKMVTRSFTRSYVGIFVALNMLVLAVALYLSPYILEQILNPPLQTYGFGMEMVVYVLVLIGTVQPIICIVSGIHYLSGRIWAQKGLLWILSLVLLFWTTVAAYMFFFEGGEVVFTILWVIIVMFVAPGIVMIYRENKNI